MNHTELLMVRKALNKRKAAGENVKSLITANEKLIRESRAARNADGKGPTRRRRAPERAPAEPIVPPPTFDPLPEDDAPPETQAEREKRISERFSTLERMASRLVENKIPALIISGPPGLGKSFTLEKKAEELEGTSRPVTIISGSISAPGLLIALHEHKDGGTVVLDDSDDVFRDETTLNLLKAVLDSSSKRVVSYHKLAKWMGDMDIPQSFEFKGSVAFCTNIDFEREIERGNRMSAHFMALIDRSLYLTLTLRGKQDFLTRIRQVAIDESLLVNNGLTKKQADEVIEYIETNSDRCYSLSIRLALQVAQCMIAEPTTWREDANATQLRTLRV